MCLEKRLLPRDEGTAPGLVDWVKLFAAAERLEFLAMAYGLAEQHEDGRFWLSKIEEMDAVGSTWVEIFASVYTAGLLLTARGDWADPEEISPRRHPPWRRVLAAVCLLEERLEPLGSTLAEGVKSKLERAIASARAEPGGSAA